MLHDLDDVIAFLSLNIDSNPYKDCFDFFYKILGFSNNEKKKSHGQIIVFLEIKLDFLIIKAQFLAN